MNVVIVGNHAAGLSAAETLRAGDPSCDIVVISNEDTPPYSRPLIPGLVSGKRTIEDILHKSATFYEERSIETMFGVEVVKVLPDRREVTLANGETVSYDALILANGATPIFPRVAGIDKKGVFPFRTLSDARNVADYCREQGVESAIVLGGGCVGLKSAEALNDLGKKVRIVVGSPNVLSQVAGPKEAGIFEDYLRSQGIEVLTGTTPETVLGDERVAGLETSDGRKFDCQLIIAAKGVSANKGIVDGTGIETEYGILVDEHCRTSVPDVYAAGDVAQTFDVARKETWTNSLWPHAVEEGRVAAESILGKDSAIKGQPTMNAVGVYDHAMISCGMTGARDVVEGGEETAVNGPGEREFRRYILRDNRLVGFVLAGQVAHAGVLTALVRKQVDIGEYKEGILAGRYDFSSLYPLIKEQPEAFNEPEYREVASFT
jgi:nitrite reductase (NADH) large subunit